MARRPSLIKLKQKKQKKTKTEAFLINQQTWGLEPTYTSKPMGVGKLAKSFNWYNYMCDIKEAREYLSTYLKNTNRETELKKLKDVPDKWLSTTACWIARMLSQGANLPDTSKTFMNERLKDMLEKDYSKKNDMETPDDEPEPAKPVVVKTVQDRQDVILEGLICELEEKVDEFITNWKPGFKMYDWLQGKEVSSVNAKRIVEFYNPQLLEIEDYYEGRLKEGYDGYTKDQLTKLFGFYVMLVEDTEQFMTNNKKVRKARTPKPMSVDKKLKDFKHLNFDNARKLQSIQPAKILQAVELWTFNTKYNQLTVFKAQEGQTLDVHRTAITNFDPIFSKTKKIRANQVDAVLKQVQDAGKVMLRNLMKDLKGSDQKLQERMNENTILLRAVNK